MDCSALSFRRSNFHISSRNLKQLRAAISRYSWGIATTPAPAPFDPCRALWTAPHWAYGEQFSHQQQPFKTIVNCKEKVTEEKEQLEATFFLHESISNKWRKHLFNTKSAAEQHSGSKWKQVKASVNKWKQCNKWHQMEASCESNKWKQETERKSKKQVEAVQIPAHQRPMTPPLVLMVLRRQGICQNLYKRLFSRKRNVKKLFFSAKWHSYTY